jgi:hypothetical protein
MIFWPTRKVLDDVRHELILDGTNTAREHIRALV